MESSVARGMPMDSGVAFGNPAQLAGAPAIVSGPIRP
jgi:hypothetical protein